MSKSYFERKIEENAMLGREELYQEIIGFNIGSFKLDFTKKYLDKCSTNRLRYILLVAQINKRHR